MMISNDDARMTLDLGDRFVIEPFSAKEWDRSRKGLNGNRVSEDFEYSSEKNNEWLDAGDYRKL